MEYWICVKSKIRGTRKEEKARNIGLNSKLDNIIVDYMCSNSFLQFFAFFFQF